MEKITEINETLKSWKVCFICRIRLLNRNFNFESIDNSIITDENFICYLCCGILQINDSNDDIIDKVVENVTKSNFKFNAFEITISTPPNLLIHEFAIWHSLKIIFVEDLKLLNIDEITTVKSILKWSIKNKVALKLDKIYLNGAVAKETRVTNNTVVNDDILSIAVNFSHEKCEAECSVLGELEPGLFQKRRRGEKRYNWEIFTRRTVIQVLNRSTKETLSRHFRMPPNHITNDILLKSEIIVSRPDPIIIGGRYCKYSRRLPQSPWIFDGVRKLEGSVEEFITSVLIKASGAESSTFISSGREDVDVRMLGNGRPFAVELKNCKNMSTNLLIKQLEEEINNGCDGKLIINHLDTVLKDSLNLIKKGEEEKSKQYRAVIYCENGVSEDDKELVLINNTKDLKVQQWTPIRVLHRRALLERPRTFYSLSAVRLNDMLTDECIQQDKSLADYLQFLQKYDNNHLFILNIRCQAGSYVKEFVHGDLGRTKPNLGTLIGQGCDILALDVMEIELDWPPKKQ